MGLFGFIRPQRGPKIAHTSALGPPGLPRDAKGRPESSREQFWSLGDYFWGLGVKHLRFCDETYAFHETNAKPHKNE